MELAGLEVALGGSVSEYEWMGRPRTLIHTAVDFINTVHLGYTQFIKQHEIKSNTGYVSLLLVVPWRTVLQPIVFL